MLEQLINPVAFLVLVILVAIALPLSIQLARNPNFGVVLIAFFLPFERIPSVDFAGFTFKINHLLGGLTFVFWILAILFQRRKLAPNPLTIPLILLFFSFILSGLGAENLFRHITVFISILITVAIFLVTLNGLTNKQTLQLIVGAIFLSAAIMGVIGLYQFAGDMAGLPSTVTGLDPGYTNAVFGFPRVHAFSKEPLYYANYLFIPLGIGLALLLSGNQQQEQSNESTSRVAQLIDRLRGPWLLPLLILLGINFILTLSRGAFIALVPFLTIFGILYAKKIFSIRNIITAVLVIGISLTAVYNILESVSPNALERFIGHATLEDVLVRQQGESGIGRLNDFDLALGAWESSPILGIGLGNFGPHITHYPLITPGTGWKIVNNEYLELLAETGILGLGLFLILLAVVLIRSLFAYRVAKDEYLKAVLVGLTAAMAAMFTQYNLFSTLYIIHIWVLLGLLLGVQNVILYKKEALP